MAAAARYGPRIRRLGQSADVGLNMGRALVLAGGLYGCEVDPLTVRQLQVLRQSMGEAAWGKRSGRNKAAALLLTKNGMGDPRLG